MQDPLSGQAGFIRQADLIGRAEVTKEQAETNKRAGRRPTRPRAERRGIIPFSGPTLWRKVKTGEFPKPIKLSERVTAWRVEDVRAWLDSKAFGN